MQEGPHTKIQKQQRPDSKEQSWWEVVRPSQPACQQYGSENLSIANTYKHALYFRAGELIFFHIKRQMKARKAISKGIA